MPKRAAILALFLCACATPKVRAVDVEGVICGTVCTADNVATTAGHCVGRQEYLTSYRDTACVALAIRATVDCETVRVEGTARGVKASCSATAISGNWLGWLIVTGRGRPGESGGGVWGADGALLGIVVETHDRLTYARLIR